MAIFNSYVSLPEGIHFVLLIKSATVPEIPRGRAFAAARATEPISCGDCCMVAATSAASAGEI